jgi:hypothetical protein
VDLAVRQLYQVLVDLHLLEDLVGQYYLHQDLEFLENPEDLKLLDILDYLHFLEDLVAQLVLEYLFQQDLDILEYLLSYISLRTLWSG